MIFSSQILNRMFIERQTSRISSENKWQRVVQRVAMNYTEWYNEWQRVATSSTTTDNECYNEWQRVTMNDNEWQRITTSGTTNVNEWYNEWKQMSDFRFQNETIMQFKTTIYTATSFWK